MTEARMEGRRLKLSGGVTIRDVDAIRQEILARLAEHAEIDIDLTEIVEADFSLIQLMLATEISAAKAGKTVRLLKPYPEDIQRSLVRAALAGTASDAGGNIWTREA